MAKAYVLNEKDAKTLAELLAAFRGKRQNVLRFTYDDALPSGNPKRTKRGFLASSLSQGTPITHTSAEFDIWTLDDDEISWEFSGDTITIWDDGMVPLDGLEAGTWIQIVKLEGYWWYDGGCSQPGTGSGSGSGTGT
jgi:hypothetical protein